MKSFMFGKLLRILTLDTNSSVEYTRHKICVAHKISRFQSSKQSEKQKKN